MAGSPAAAAAPAAGKDPAAAAAAAATAEAERDDDEEEEEEGPPSRMEHPAATLEKDPSGEEDWPLIMQCTSELYYYYEADFLLLTLDL